jgi:hypothetical protein
MTTNDICGLKKPALARIGVWLATRVSVSAHLPMGGATPATEVNTRAARHDARSVMSVCGMIGAAVTGIT